MFPERKGRYVIRGYGKARFLAEFLLVQFLSGAEEVDASTPSLSASGMGDFHCT